MRDDTVSEDVNVNGVARPDEALRERLVRLFSETPARGIVSAYLFGSHAQGRAHRESDVDVAVLLSRGVFQGDNARFNERVRLSAWLVGELRWNLVDVIVLNDVPPTLARRIVTTGVRVFCRDPETDHAFRRDTQLRAADLEPFLRRMRRLKLAALAR